MIKFRIREDKYSDGQSKFFVEAKSDGPVYSIWSQVRGPFLNLATARIAQELAKQAVAVKTLTVYHE